MEEEKFVRLKKEEYKIKEYVKKQLGKGKMSSIHIEYTPVGEKITITTTSPGYVIGRSGERIEGLTKILKKRFGLENPHIEIDEVEKPEFDSQYVADSIAQGLERFGPIRFKAIAYKMLERIVKAGAKGVEIRLSGKLPSDRSRSWRFAHGYLKKTGETAKVVNRAKAEANTISGTVGIKVSILPANVRLHDQVEVEEIIEEIEASKNKEEKKEGGDKKKHKKKKKSKK